MYHDFEVGLPKVKGKIITRKKGAATYILYQYGSKYNPEKKYAVPQRTIIGKVNPEHPDHMFPNEKYEEYFPDAAIPEELPESSRSFSLRIGAYAIIKKVFEEYKLPQKLSKWFGDDTGLLMDLIAYLIVDEENAGQYYPDFAYDHPLFSKNMHIYSDSKVCRFFKNVTREQMNGFLDDWNKSRDHKDRIYISYDSTNKNCQSGDIDILEYGKAKVDTGSAIFNLALAFDKNNRVPLFYETYGGSITDVAQFTYMVDKVKEYGYDKVGFVLDRGYFSKDNIRYMEENKYSFIIMAKGCKKLVSELVREHRNTFETDRDCAIRTYRVYGKTILSPLYEDDTANRYFHLYFNPSKQAAERELLEQRLDSLKLNLDKHKGTDATFGKAYHDYFDIRYDKDGNLASYKEKKDVIQERLELCGYFCIITSEKMTAAEALIHYKGRDISEKIFSSDKSFLGSKSMRVQSGASLDAKIFTEFAALIVRNRIYNLLKEMMLRMETKSNYMTVPAALKELEKIEMVRRNNGKYHLDHAVSRKQRILLSAFGMDDQDIRRLAATISKLLATNQSLLSDDMMDQEEEYYGENAFDDFD